MCTLGAIASILASGCVAPSGPTVTTSCVAVANIGGVTFVVRGWGAHTPPDTGQLVAVIERQVRCNDTPVDLIEIPDLSPGESNTLPPGARIYSRPGVSPDTSLVTMQGGFWSELVPSHLLGQ